MGGSNLLQMTNNSLLGKLLSEHQRGDDTGRGRHSRRALLGCGLILILPLIFGLWGSVAYFTSNKNDDATLGLAVSLALVGISIGLFGLFALLSFVSPLWMKKYKLEIYENGIMLRTPFKTQSCLWDEIRGVNPILLTTQANRAKTNPGDFRATGNTQYGGIYEIQIKDGSKILVSRQYSGIDAIDSALKPFCKEGPQW